ncbi:MAG TPA: hypothetical protein VGM93_09800 [Acidimicrobiales bacterium]
MTLSLLAAVAAAVCFGVGSVLQAIGARRTAAAENLDPRLLVRLIAELPYALGLGLDALGVVATVVALRRLPLFVVQAGIAGSVAVTALVASRMAHARLTRSERGGVLAVVAGLCLLAMAAGPEGPPRTELALRWGLLGAALVAIAVAAVAARRTRAGTHAKASAAVLGALAGALYGIGNTSIRVIRDLHLATLVQNPAAYAAAASAIGGSLVFGTALQRGSVTSATGALTAAETLLPAVFGLAVLHEGCRPGWVPIAVIGFVLTVGGAVELSRWGELPSPEPSGERGPAPTG